MGYGSIDVPIMQIVLIAVFFHQIALTLQIYLLYLEQRFQAVIAAFLYFLVNAGTLIVMLIFGVELPGISFLLGAVVAVVYSGISLWRRAPIVDYLIFNQN